MSVTFTRVGRTWSITDFRNRQHTQPKSPDASGTPGFPDGIFNDFLAEASKVLSSVDAAASVAQAAITAVNSASALLAALSTVAPSVSANVAGAVLTVKPDGTGYTLPQWQILNSTTASTISVSTAPLYLLVDTTGGPFTKVVTGTPKNYDLIRIRDYVRQFDTKNFTLVLPAPVAGSAYASTATVIFDVAGDMADFLYLSGFFREI